MNVGEGEVIRKTALGSPEKDSILAEKLYDI